jgi:hypothetical protein
MLRRLLILALAFVSIAAFSTSLKAETIFFAIISPDLPFSDAEMNGDGRNPGYVGQFTRVIEESLGSVTIRGRYFRSYSQADAYIKRYRNVFIMSTIGYYLSRKNTLGLEPLADMIQNSTNRYYVMTGGSYGNLSSLRGKSLTGSVLYQGQRFLDKVVFDGKLDASRYFSLRPTTRIRSAVRKVTRGDIQAVVINQRDYQKFSRYSFFKNMKTVYTSPEVSSLGVMTKISTNEILKRQVFEALTKIGDKEDAGPMLRANGIEGFTSVNRSLLQATEERYEK